MQMDILQKMSKGQLKIPSEKQSAILYNLLELAEAEGVDI